MDPKRFFLYLIFAMSSGKNLMMLYVRILVRLFTKDVVPRQFGGREE